jgi:hypothetical protein
MRGFLIAMLLAGLFLAGSHGYLEENPALAADDTAGIDTHAPSQMEEQGFFRIVQAVPGLPPVSVFMERLDSDVVTFFGPVIAGMLPGTTTDRSSVVEAPVGQYRLRVEATDSAEQMYLEQEVEIVTNTAKIFAVMGTPDNITLGVFEEDFSPLQPGLARVVLLNLLPDADSLSVWSNDSRLIEGTPFGQMSAPADVAPSTYDFELMQGQNVLMNLPQSLNAGVVYTILAMRDVNGEYDARPFIGNPPPFTFVRFTHAAPDAGPIDVFLDEELLAANVNFSESADFSEWASRNYMLTVNPAGATAETPPLLQRNILLEENRTVELVFLGSSEDLQVVQHEIDLSPLGEDEIRLLVINAVAGEESGYLVLGSGRVLEDGTAEFGEVTEPNVIQAGQEQFFYESNDPSARPFESTGSLELESGMVYTYIPTGFTGPSPILLSTSVNQLNQLDDDEDDEDLSAGADNGGYQLTVFNLTSQDMDVYDSDGNSLGLVVSERVSSPIYFPVESVAIVELRLIDGTVAGREEILIEEETSEILMIFDNNGSYELRRLGDLESRVSVDEALIRFTHAASELPPVAVLFQYESGSGDQIATEVPSEDGESSEFANDLIELLRPFGATDIIALSPGVISFEIIQRVEGDNRSLGFLPIQILEGGNLYEAVIYSDGAEDFRVEFLRR